jgi:hypothetical protein
MAAYVHVMRFLYFLGVRVGGVTDEYMLPKDPYPDGPRSGRIR